ncbi:ABC transporter permease [Mycolicibacterium phlei]|uniref:ABC transporter permease n=1 Tax=Mycolicibacterium phlei DSM 43239 = CCUG 21000 TaxID=1226750 RepID=A0A5N5URE7_MYCPH|nr:ABC transporter permease [Mycolicibacterium phlei DSM 43239 = CCUG 21000]KXW59616.1 ABC transporter permease [Mycolicibacterium phlei DSM 43072]KXW60525.1 ABC transporter permease [Mycolicibacterium phlei DSM 43239 = CCUG 21000]KXW74134.1 ABC transporter permease [Mycolicibacterium phlei DSM 43070]KXW78856.1 ABC transporter permease [Mycolicibacterium phlei DSM 43071]
MTTTTPAIKPIKEIGGFFAMSLDAMVAALAPPFAFREFVLQTWFVARVSLLPTMMLSIPFCTLVVFMANIMLGEIGASDASGTGAAMACVNQIGPIVTVVVVAGAGATAMCADLGARTIREELDAMRVMGIDPIQRLVVPRVLAATLVALLLNGVVTIVGLMGSFFFSVYVQHVAPGAFVAGLTLLVGLPEIVIATVKALLFGFAAGLIACYKGMTVGGGSQGVGTAVNETVVYAFMALFVINVLVTAIGFQVS